MSEPIRFLTSLGQVLSAIGLYKVGHPARERALDNAYERFTTRVAAGSSGGTKQDRIRDFVLLHASTTFTIADIRRAVPGVGDSTIRIVLAELKSAGRIANDGTGRGATWHRT